MSKFSIRCDIFNPVASLKREQKLREMRAESDERQKARNGRNRREARRRKSEKARFSVGLPVETVHEGKKGVVWKVLPTNSIEVKFSSGRKQTYAPRALRPLQSEEHAS